MKRYWMIAVAAAVTLSLPVVDADAKRMGGGGSAGRQSPQVTQRAAPPAQTPPVNQAAPAAPQGMAAQPGARPNAQAAAPAAGAAAAAQQGRRSWLGPIAGIAAGLGLAALASHLGFGEGLASFMLLMLVVIAAFALFRFLRARRTVSRANPYQPAYSYGGVGQEASVSGYTPPPPGGTRPIDVVRPVAAAAATAAPAAWQVPADFDGEGFVKQAKAQYVRLQAAYDSADVATLQEFSTADMFRQLRQDIDARQGAANRTDVVTLDAELLGIALEGDEHVASVRFHGMIREVDGQAAQPFDEVWNLVKPVDGSSGWLLAGIQALN